MKKRPTPPRKPKLVKQTLRVLTIRPEDLKLAAGGRSPGEDQSK